MDVRNALIGLQQARARYETAVATRVLAEQSLKAEQDKFKYGATGTDVTTVIQAQKDLVNDQTLEAQAMANYTHARISFDQALGRTLEVNHVSMAEAVSGKVARESVAAREFAGSREMKNLFRQSLALICTGAMLYGQAPTVSRPATPVWWRPYMPTTISPARMTNTQRIHSLMRAGKLYLTLQDAIALAIENDLNLEVARTNPINAEWAIERAQAGGAPRGVASASTNIGGATAGFGRAGQRASSAGISAGGGGSVGGNGAGGVTTSQIGTTAQVMDPFIQDQTSFSHITYPQAIQAISGVPTLVDNQRIYSNLIQQGLPTGGFVQFKAYNQYLNENSPGDNYNPANGAYLQLTRRFPCSRGGAWP